MRAHTSARAGVRAGHGVIAGGP